MPNNGPLRRIDHVLEWAKRDSRDLVKLECSHEQRTYSTLHGQCRCKSCDAMDQERG